MHVILGIVIAGDGSVIDTDVLRSIPELDQAAIDAVNQWQFEPTLLNGEPVEVEMKIGAAIVQVVTEPVGQNVALC